MVTDDASQRRMRQGIARWVSAAVRGAGRGVGRLGPVALVATLAGAAFAPLVAVVLAVPVAGLGNAAVQFAGGLGGNYLAGVLATVIDRLRGHGGSVDEATLREVLAEEFRRHMEVGDEPAQNLRGELGAILAAVGGVRAAVEAVQAAAPGDLDAERASELAADLRVMVEALPELGGYFDGFHKLGGVLLETLVASNALQRQSMESTRRLAITMSALRDERPPDPAPPDPAPADAAPQTVAIVDPRLPSPYPGMAAFQTDDADNFFGRERLTALLANEVAERVAGSEAAGRPSRTAVLAVVGPSGAGKSSLLRAGLLAAVVRGKIPVPGSADWPTLLLTPGSDPLAELALGVAEEAGAAVGPVLDDLRADPGRAVLAVRQALLHSRNRRREVAGARPHDAGVDHEAGHRFVVVVDQFEEVFTLCTDEARRTSFIRALHAIATPADDRPAPAVVLLGIRADFYGACLSRPDLVKLLRDNQFVVEAMSDDEVRDAVERPARRHRITLQPGFSEVVLRDLRRRSLLTSTAPHGYEAGALPLMAHALRETFEQRTGSGLTITGYEDTGGIDGAVGRTADACYRNLSEPGRRIARKLLLRLVNTGKETDTRQPVARHHLFDLVGGSRAEAEQVLAVLVQARLLTSDGDTVQITHEALLWAWEKLHGWLNEKRAWRTIHRQLHDAAAVWHEQGRPAGIMLPGTSLELVEYWLSDADLLDDLSEVELAFVEHSREQRAAALAAARQRDRRRRQLIVVLSGLTALTMTAAAVALQQRQVAVDQRQQALSRQVAVQSDVLGGRQPRESMLLAAAAWRLSPTTQARGSLLSTQRQPYAGTLDPGRTVTAVAYSPDGTVLASGGSDGEVRLYRGGQRTPVVLPAHPSGVHALAFSPDGRTLATAGEDGFARLWQVGSGAKLADLPHRFPVLALAFSPDGGSLATAAADLVGVWDVAGRRLRTSLRGDAADKAVLDVAYSPDGATLAAATVGGRIRLWSTATSTTTAVRDEVVAVNSVAFSPDGRYLAAGLLVGVLLWDRNDPTAQPWRDGTGQVADTAFDATGHRMAYLGADRAVHVVDVASKGELEPLTGHTTAGRSVAFRPDGRRLASGADGVLLWDTSRIPATRPSGGSGVSAADRVGARVATGGTDGAVTLWDTRTRRPLGTTTGTGTPTTWLGLSPDATMLAAAGLDGTRLWDTADLGAPRTLPLPGTREVPTAFAFAGGDTFAVASAHRIWLYDTRTGAVRGSFGASAATVSAIAASPDGSWLATAGDDRQPVQVWDLRTHESRATLTGAREQIRILAFSPDGRWLAGVGDDRTVVVWNATSGKVAATLPGATGTVSGLAWAPDSGTLAAVESGAVRIWNPHTSTLVAALSIDGAVPSVALVPGGNGPDLLLGAPAMTRWSLRPERVLSDLCAAGLANLTGAEWRRYVGDAARQPACP